MCAWQQCYQKFYANPHLACLAVLMTIIPFSKVNKLLYAQKELVHSDSTLQALVVQKMDSTVHQINHYEVGNVTGFPYTYPLNGAIHPINRYTVDKYQGNQLHLLLSVVYARKDHRNDIKMLQQAPWERMDIQWKNKFRLLLSLPRLSVISELPVSCDHKKI